MKWVFICEDPTPFNSSEWSVRSTRLSSLQREPRERKRDMCEMLLLFLASLCCILDSNRFHSANAYTIQYTYTLYYYNDDECCLQKVLSETYSIAVCRSRVDLIWFIRFIFSINNHVDNGNILSQDIVLLIYDFSSSQIQQICRIFAQRKCGPYLFLALTIRWINQTESRNQLWLR